MKPFTLYRIIFLVFILGVNNLYAVQPNSTESEKIESVAKISANKVIKDSPKKSKRKSRLLERIKEKFDDIFSDDSSQNTNLETKRHGLAVSSLVFGILSFPGLLIGIGFLFALLAIIFGAVASGKIKRSGGFYTGKGMAKAGLILGIIPLAFLMLILIIILSVGGF